MKNTQPISGYSADTEILTRHGWTRFPELTYMSEVATRSPDGRFEWQYPERIICEPYDGPMAWFHGRSMDMLVTSGHPVPWVPDKRSRERFAPAAFLVERSARVRRANDAAALVATSMWDVPELAEKVFLGVRRTKMGPKPLDVRMTGDQFAAFMGMYVAEGCSVPTPRDWRVLISQSEDGKGWNEYRTLLVDIFGAEPARSGGSWVITSRALYEYMRPLGKALTKHLPAEVLDLPRRQLEIFWRYYFLGDGNYEAHRHTARPGEVVATGSLQLAGQLQEVVQKLGYSGSVRRYAHRPNAKVRAKGFIYKVRIRRTLYPACSVEQIPYAGIVASVKVENSMVYVRRDGHPVWSGT